MDVRVTLLAVAAIRASELFESGRWMCKNEQVAAKAMGELAVDETLSYEREWLRSAGLQPTRQRVTLARLLVGDRNNKHVTANRLHSQAVHAGESMSLATVYNTLRVLCSAGLLKEITVDGSRSWFDTRVDDHPHFYWEDTGELADASEGPISLPEISDLPEGVEIAEVDVVIRLRRK